MRILFLMEVALAFVYRLRSKLNGQTLEGLNIHGREQNAGVYLASGKFWKLVKSRLCIRIVLGTGGQGNQDFIGMKTRVSASQILGL